MIHRFLTSARALIVALGLAALAAGPVLAQPVGAVSEKGAVRDPDIPRFKPAAPPTPAQVAARAKAQTAIQKIMDDQRAKPTPKTADGKVDLSGIWAGVGPDRGGNGGAPSIDAAGNIVLDFPDYGGGGKAPLPADGPKYKPELVAKVDYNDEHSSFIDMTFQCAMPGVPRLGAPAQIVQTPKEVVLLYTAVSGQTFRVIPTDGRGFRPEIDPSYNGDSVGRWEGDTLIVDSKNFIDETWLGGRGYFHTDQMTVQERFTRVGDLLTYSVTVTDPGVLTEAWSPAPRNLSPTAARLEESPRCIDIVRDHLVNTDNHS